MEKDIVEGKIGTVGEYDVEFKGGKFIVKIGAQPGVGVSVAVEAAVEAKAFLAAIKKAIPGQIDDAVIGVLEAALLG